MKQLPHRSRRGFTLIEVLVTLSIMALIMTGLHYTLHSTIYTHDEVALELASVREGYRILDLVERDLQGLYCYNIKDSEVMRGENQRHLNKRADRLDFLTHTDSTIERIEDPLGSEDEPLLIPSDVTEVGYRLRARTDGADYLELYRREDVFIDEEPLAGGRYEKLHDSVSMFKVTYFKDLGDDAEELDEWDMKEENALPAAIRIDLELMTNPALAGDFEDQEMRAQNTYPYTRTIAIYPVHNDTLRVRPVMPVLIDPEKQDEGAGGGGLRGGGGAGGGRGMGGDGSGGDRGTVGDGKRPGDGMGNGRGGGTMIGNEGGNRRGVDFNFGGEGGEFGGDLTDDQRTQLDDFLDKYRDQFGSGAGGGGNPFGGGR